jgi:hypothetical protein
MVAKKKSAKRPTTKRSKRGNAKKSGFRKSSSKKSGAKKIGVKKAISSAQGQTQFINVKLAAKPTTFRAKCNRGDLAGSTHESYPAALNEALAHQSNNPGHKVVVIAEQKG